jgi:hypothetical protein
MAIMTHIDVHTENDLKDITLCKEIYGVLEQNYPGHPWVVGANHESGVVDIQLAYMDAFGRVSRYGYGLNIPNFDAATMAKKVRRAGGELLERSRLPRRGASDSSEAIYAEQGLDRG